VSLSTVIDAVTEEEQEQEGRGLDERSGSGRRKIVRAEVGIITTVDVMVADAANGDIILAPNIILATVA
jgi:hypothetical protein